MFYLEFLKQAVDPVDGVTRSFIECMVPAMMEQYAVKSAKGGDHSRDARLDEETKRKFEEKPDQSMFSHQLNGIFPSVRLLNLLEAEGLGAIPFTEVERKVYMLAYLMHDVDKIVHIHGVETNDRDAIERAKDLVAEQLRLCKVEAFFPDFAAYLEDITYLVVNTQQKWGTNLHTFNWRLQLKERRLLLLRRLCTYSDHIAYLVTSPAAIVGDAETKTLTTILSELSDDELVFTYHQLREVRGLFTNVVNNGMVHLFTDGRSGVWPYLFFSNGVVYIKRKALRLALSTAQIVETVQAQLRQICAGTIKSQAPGFKFDNKGIAKHPDYYFEFLSLEEYFELLARFTINRTNNDVVVGPLDKIRQMQADGQVGADLPLTFTTDKRTGMVSRFFSVVFGTVLGMFEKKQEALHRQVEEKMIKHLELSSYWEQAQTIPGKGGTEYRWFWLGACYLRDHPGMDENKLLELFISTLQMIAQLAGDELSRSLPQKYLSHLARYLDSAIELPLSIRAEGTLPDFQAEMERYAGAKNKGRKEKICTLCNSAYPTEEQSDNAMLFQPFVYKNKLSLYAGSSAGGVCAICALELMLRQILQKGQMRLTGSKFEALKTKYLAIYPNYFFTAETGAMVQGILDQLQDINFFTVRKQLDGQDMTIADLLQLHAFAANKQTQNTLEVFIYEDDGAEEEDDSPLGEEGAEGNGGQAEGSQDNKTERSYIKFEPMAYPGLCFFGMKAGKDDNDTSTWAMPAFLALALPLVTNTKVVISEMTLPLFATGHDFRETVIFDAPHPYLDCLLQEKRVRVNELLSKLRLLAAVYRVNLDTYAKQGKPEWKHLSGIARDLETDPLFLFSYLKKQQRGDGLYPREVEQYIHIFVTILEEDLGNIKECVDRHTVFYHGGYNSHSILKPVDIVAKAIINSPLNIDKEDQLWQIQGELANWLARVRTRQATGYAVFRGRDIDTQQAPAVREFVRYFYEEVFLKYCQGERGILRSRINRFKDGCEAYYVYWRGQQGVKEEEQDQEVEAEIL